MESTAMSQGEEELEGAQQVTLIHIGDIHGHLLPRPDLVRDPQGGTLGGLARMYSCISRIRARCPEALLINTGDTVQGSAEALYTRGEALIRVLNHFGIDAFAPGNWDYVYGTERFLDLFGGDTPLAPWHAIAANLYYDGEPYAEQTGKRVLSPYLVRTVNGVRIGLLGMTSERGPQAVGKGISRGFRFTKGDEEVAEFVPLLREQEGVDLVVMISELGLANNIRLAENHPGIDVVLSSDMHELTREPVVTRTGTVIVEEGQDGMVVGEVTVWLRQGEKTRWRFRCHDIDASLPDDPDIAALVTEVRRPFVEGPDFVPHQNPFNGTLLDRPIDSVVGYTDVALHRAHTCDHEMPAVIEGSSHDFLTDAFREQAGADIGAIRGFRYGTHIAPGPIKLEDLYHYIPIGPLIAKGMVTGEAIHRQMERSADGSLNPDMSKWTGGWFYGYSGATLQLDAYRCKGERIHNVRIWDRRDSTWKPLEQARKYSYASYYYPTEGAVLNGLEAEDVTVVTDEMGTPLDGVEVVVRYLASLPGRRARPTLNRVELVRPLPGPQFGNREIQPLCGVPPGGTA